jgi:glycosyltransferase involved in cell wall biosynthesis
MRILVVTPMETFPPTRGGAVRPHNLAQQLGRRHEVTLFTQGSVRASRQLGRLGDAWAPPSYSAVRYDNLLSRLVTEVGHRSWVSAPVLSGAALQVTRPASLASLLDWAEVAIVEYPWQFGYCASRRPRPRLVLDALNVEGVKFRSWAQAAGVSPDRSPWVRHIRRCEAAAIARADLVLAVTAEERLELIRRYSAEPERVVEIPNGADTERYAPVDPETRASRKRELGLPARPTVLFIGGDIPPNWAGLEWVRRLAAASGELSFLVVGNVSPPLRQGNLIATGLVDDVAPYLEAADFAVCPIEHGAGTKIKLWESLAAGLPSVAFAESVRGTALRDGNQLLIAEKSVASLHSTLARLLENPAFAAALGAAARSHVVEHHDWRISAERIESALLRLVELGPA